MYDVYEYVPDKAYFDEWYFRSIKKLSEAVAQCVHEAGMPPELGRDILQDILYTLTRDCFSNSKREVSDCQG